MAWEYVILSREPYEIVLRLRLPHHSLHAEHHRHTRRELCKRRPATSTGTWKLWCCEIVITRTIQARVRGLGAQLKSRAGLANAEVILLTPDCAQLLCLTTSG